MTAARNGSIQASVAARVARRRSAAGPGVAAGQCRQPDHLQRQRTGELDRAEHAARPSAARRGDVLRHARAVGEPGGDERPGLGVGRIQRRLHERGEADRLTNSSASS